MRVLSRLAGLLVAALTLVQAPESHAQSSPGVKFFIGLTRGQLGIDQDAGVRTFIVLQDVAKSIKTQLTTRDRTIRVGDLYTWDESRDDWWQELAKRGYTHYLVAEPKTESPPGLGPAVRIRWIVGEISPGKTRTFAGSLKRDEKDPLITIPKLQKAVLQERKNDPTRPWGDVDEAEFAAEIVKKLQAIFPPLRSRHYYFVRCFANSLRADDEEWRAAHAKLTVYLSQGLPVGAWLPAGDILGQKDAEKYCGGGGEEKPYLDDARFGYPRANLVIRGSLVWRNDAKRNIRPEIVLENRLSHLRDTLVTPTAGNETVNLFEELKEFCVPRAKPPWSDAENRLIKYVQARGLKSGAAGAGVLAREWSCNALP